MNSSKKIVNGIVWTSFQTIVNGVYGFISVPLLLAYFGKTNYGLIGLAMSINVYLRLMEMGLITTSIRYFSNWNATKEFGKINKLFTTNLFFFGVIGILNAFILLIVSFFSNRLFDVTPEQDLILKHLMYILSISSFISWLTSVFNQILQGHEYVGWVQKFVFIPKLIQIFILVLTLTFKFNIEWYYALTTYATFTTLPIIIWKIRNVCPYVSFVPKFDKKIFKEVLSYSLQLFSFSMFQFSAFNLRPIILGMQGSVDSVADYRILYGIVNVVLMMGGTFVGVVLPSAAKIVAEDNIDAQHKLAYQGTKYLTFFLCFCAFGVTSISKDLLIAYVGKEYLYLIFWLNLWLFSTLSSHVQCLSSLILAGTNLKSITYITIFASCVTIISCWFMVPYMGVGGAILSYTFFSIILILFYYCYYYPKVMQLNVRFLLYCVIPFVVMGFGIGCFIMNMSFNYGEWGNIIIKGVIFSFIYMLSSCLFFNKKDKQFFLGLIWKK